LKSIKEITEEYDITTVIILDMNSNGNWREHFFLKRIKSLEGKRRNFQTDNQDVIDFVYSSNLFKSQRSLLKGVTLD
jgi:phospholipid/cholesterol/gamma-HCH transport system ATP-binding protein